MQTESPSPSVPVRGGIAVVQGALANLVLVLEAGTLGTGPGFRAVTIPPVAFLSVLGVGGATAVYWLLGRYVPEIGRTFVRVAAVVLLLSFLPDVALLVTDPTAPPLAVIVLMAMHVVVAAVSVGLLVYWRAVS